MTMSFYPASPTSSPSRGAACLRTPSTRPDLCPDRTIALLGKAGVRRLPDFSILIPRDPSAVLPQGVPASTLRRSGFIL
jgi:hypothetical protein